MDKGFALEIGRAGAEMFMHEILKGLNEIKYVSYLYGAMVKKLTLSNIFVNYFNVCCSSSLYLVNSEWFCAF